MSTDLDQNAIDDGTGDRIPAPSGADGGGQPRDEHGRFAPKGQEGDEDRIPDWQAQLAEDERAYLAGKRWNSPADIVKAQREAEAALRRAQDEAAHYRQMLESIPQLPGQAGENGQQRLTPELIGQAYDAGEISGPQMVALLDQLAQERIEERIGQFAAERVEPGIQWMHWNELQRTAAEMRQTYPDFNDLSQDVLAMIERNPELYNSAEGMRAAYGLVRAERDAQQAAERARASQAEMLGAGGRGPAQREQDAAEAIRQAIENVGRRLDDGIN